MKIAIMLLVLTVSFSSHALDVSLSPTLSSALSVAGDDFKLAKAIINDSQDFYQTGKLSLTLSSYVSDLLSQNSDLSVVDAVDALASQAEASLK